VKGQLSIETMLIVLLAMAAVAGFFLFVNRLVTIGLSGSEKSLVYPENPPQIIDFKCYASYAQVAIAEELNGTINFRLKNLNGTEINASTLTANIASYGILNITGNMEDGSYYELRLFTPKWSVAETCTP
jgi:hypothetical protein